MKTPTSSSLLLTLFGAVTSVVGIACGSEAVPPSTPIALEAAPPSASRLPIAPTDAGIDLELLVKARTQAIMANEEKWEQAWDEALDKIAPCAAAVPTISVGAPSTHHKGEKYLTYVYGGAFEYKHGMALPMGSAVIKKTFLPASNKTTAYFLMMKEPGVHQAGGNWIYSTTTPEGDYIRGGILKECSTCHEKQAEHDYLFRAHSRHIDTPNLYP